ncbi:nitrate reductase cytochrome c-type subunit [Bradyrhizobium sp. GM24.11]
MMKRFGIALLACAIAAGASSLAAQTVTSGLRGPTPLDDEGPAPPMLPNRNTSERESRNYPEQPPVIPHTIDGYQIDLNSNKCLSCHARSRTSESQAPMVSITHFMDATASSSLQSRRGASSAPNATCHRIPRRRR